MTPWRWLRIPGWLLWCYRRPALFLAVLTAVPLLAVSVWIAARQERQWRARESEDLLVSARLASRLIEAELDGIRRMQDAFVAQPGFAEAVRRDPAKLATQLRLLQTLLPHLIRVELAGPPAAAEAPPPLSPVYLYDEVSGEKAVKISSVIHDGETVLGTLEAHLRLGEISSWLAPIRIEPAGFLYVVDRQGLLVVYPFQLVPGKPKDVSNWAPVRAAVSEGGAVVRFRHGPAKRRWTAAVVPMSAFGWRVIAQQPDDEMLRPLHRFFGSMLAVLVVLLALLVLGIRSWTSVHRAALALIARQAELLKAGQSQRIRRQRREPPDG